ncbi:hypothetical protein [uncultured Jatrophihabitans sp.]|uniref:hypothetical protein n=1 Tax=uncultured Jatrophihabitans sp. TaxID=1610747 RepID=UPI0035CB4E60
MRAPDRFLDRVRASTVDDVRTVDLRAVDWVTPTVMVAVAAQAQHAAAHGTAFAVRAPARAEPGSYAARMRLGAVLDSLGARHDLPVRRTERDQRTNLVELSEVAREADASRLAALVHRKLRSQDSRLADALHASIGEIGVNVPDHATTVGYMAAQTLPRRNTLLVAVADAGVGLLHTLRKRGADTDEHAIDLAMRPDVSEYDDPSRGAGLPTVLRLVRGLGGSVYLASGAAAIRHHARTRRYTSAAQPLVGTIVEIRIPL